MKTKTVPISRAFAALVLGCGYTACTMYLISKGLLIKQAFANELQKARS